MRLCAPRDLNAPVPHREGITGPHCQDCNLGNDARQKQRAAADIAGCMIEEKLSARIMLRTSRSLRFRFIRKLQCGSNHVTLARSSLVQAGVLAWLYGLAPDKRISR